MSGSVNTLPDMYRAGQSIPQIAARTGINRSRVRRLLMEAGVELRSRAEGVRLRSEDIGAKLRGQTRVFTEDWKSNIGDARRRWADENAAGLSKKASGYVVHTRGEHKHRSEHTTIVEAWIGRRLRPGEVVHHIDRDRSNNSIDNLALVTRSGHTRLHRFEDTLGGIERERANGRFS